MQHLTSGCESLFFFSSSAEVAGGTAGHEADQVREPHQVMGRHLHPLPETLTVDHHQQLPAQHEYRHLDAALHR